MALTTERQRAVPARLLAALRHVGVSEEDLRHHYDIPPDEPLPPAAPEPLTVDDMERVPDDGYRYELWDGELKRMCPSKRRHGGVAGVIVRKLSVYLEQNPLGSIYIAGAGFRAGPRASLYCPDASYVSTEREADVGQDEFFPYAPDIAIEVWSPENTEREMKTKAAHYLAHGGKAVWVLRPQDRTVRVHRPGRPVRTLRGDELLTDDALPGFAVRVDDLFPR
jgi:Uma2 family endonuclease